MTQMGFEKGALRRVCVSNRGKVTDIWRKRHCNDNTFYSSFVNYYCCWSCYSTVLDRLLGLREVEAPRICRQSAHEGGKVVSLTHRPPLPQEISLVLISVRGWIDPRAKMPPEGLSQWEILMTALEMELATFRLVAQCVNQLRCNYLYIMTKCMY
jgi:hypothetical protein